MEIIVDRLRIDVGDIQHLVELNLQNVVVAYDLFFEFLMKECGLNIYVMEFQIKFDCERDE